MGRAAVEDWWLEQFLKTRSLEAEGWRCKGWGVA